MKGQHTQGRLAISEHGDAINEDDGVVIARFYSDFTADELRRAVACWNACNSLPTQTLEVLPGYAAAIAGANNANSALDAARALLAEVVQLDYGVVDSSYGHCTPSAEFYEVLSRIRTFQKGADA